MKIIITIIITVILILGIPWYVQQLGRFFCSGIFEIFNEKGITIKKGDKNAKKEKR